MARLRVHRLAGVLVLFALVVAASLVLHRSPSSSPPFEPGCTLVVNVFSRPTTVAESLRHYAHTSSITHIVLLWAGPAEANETDLAVAAGTTRLSLVVPPSTSLNWRFYPWPEIRTECVISMDDDWRMPHDHLDRVSQVWHSGYRDRFVGLEHMGRNHVERSLTDDDDDDVSPRQPVYAPTFWSQYTAKPAVMPPSKFHSIVLPSGAALSRKFFEAYHAPQWAAARAVVDELTNCEDLLMNYVVANLSGPRLGGPALVRAWHKPFQVDGLWFRPKHLGTRSECLQRFARLTDTRLVYSDAYVPLDDAEVGVPPPEAYSYSTEIPFDLPCARKVFDDEGICELVDSDAGWRKLGQPWIDRGR